VVSRGRARRRAVVLVKPGHNQGKPGRDGEADFDHLSDARPRQRPRLADAISERPGHYRAVARRQAIPTEPEEGPVHVPEQGRDLGDELEHLPQPPHIAPKCRSYCLDVGLARRGTAGPRRLPGGSWETARAISRSANETSARRLIPHLTRGRMSNRAKAAECVSGSSGGAGFAEGPELGGGAEASP